MAHRPKRPCASPGCPNLIPTGKGSYCDEHRRPRRSGKPTSARGYDGEWRRVRAEVLAEQPYCAIADCGEPATVVHHLNWDHHDNRRENLVGLCARHHANMKKPK